jgi:hypothetical protein
LSGDYIVQGEWDLAGKHYVCTQKVQVRAPGIRAELCWDSVGGEEAVNPAGNDIDLHFARLQGVDCSTQGWDQTCQSAVFGANEEQDCYWDPTSGCRDYSRSPPGWGYADSPDSACLGWSSKRHPKGTMDRNLGLRFVQGCTNPRLDKDNIQCDKTVDDPTINNSGALSGEFCGPENINLDNPKDGDAFAVEVNHYSNSSGPPQAHPHVNLYCNGARVLSVGYDPLTGQTAYPLLQTDGSDDSGDYWEVGQIKAHVMGGQLTSCDVTTVPSHHADQVLDGPTTATPTGSAGNQLCVDTTVSQANPPFNYTNHAFLENTALQGGRAGGRPASAAAFCKH